MRLFSFWRSSASWRVRIALAHKGLAYEYVPVHLGRGEQYADSYVAALNPISQVPVLELDGSPPRRLSQSLAILEYLEEQFPLPPLLPVDPFLRGRARQLAEIVNAGIQPFQNVPPQVYVRDVLRGDELAWTQHFIARGLRALERSALETAGTFLVGGQPSIADVCSIPQLYSARRFAVSLDPYPTLVRCEAACLALPAFTTTHPDKQPDAVPV
jgi:maleylpyruvate isomerase